MAYETDDPVKSKLLKKSARYLEDLENETKEISERTQKILTNALVIGGSLAVAYFTYSQFSGGTKKEKSKKEKTSEEGKEKSGPSIITQIGTAFLNQASVFLLNLAKEKLVEFLQAQENTETEADEHP